MELIKIKLSNKWGKYMFLFKNKNNNKHKLLSNQTELTYEINSGIPFRWDAYVEDESILKFVEKYVLKDENKGAICGAPVHYNYVFEGLSEGETTITFKCYNFADDYVSKEDKYRVVVDSNKKVTIYNNYDE